MPLSEFSSVLSSVSSSVSGAVVAGRASTARHGVLRAALALAVLTTAGHAFAANQTATTFTVRRLYGFGASGQWRRHLPGPATFPVGANPKCVVVADLDGDGKLDLATASELNGTVSILLGAGDGAFQADHEYLVNGPVVVPKAEFLSVGDFNGDGVPDLAVESYLPDFPNLGIRALSILTGNGDGAFQNLVTFTVGTVPLPVGAVEAHSTVGDLNGDGKLDLVVPQSHSVAVYLGNGDGTFGSSQDPQLYYTDTNPS